MFCKQCGIEIPNEAVICVRCGVSTDNYHMPRNSRKNRSAYILLGFFLGGLGIHNFYAGYNGKGITQLLCLLLGAPLLFIPWVILIVWVLVEIITVDKDAQGNKFS